MKLRVVLVGFGFMGQMHARVYRALAEAGRALEVAAIADSFSGTAEAAGKLGVDAPVFRSLNEALRNCDSNVVDICLPTDLHASHIHAAVKAGKHVFCEKPLGLDFREAEEAVAAAESQGVVLQVGQCIRFWPEYQALQQFIESGRGGRLRRLSLLRRAARPLYSRDNWLHQPERSKGAALDLHIHDTDFILHLLGKPKSVSTLGRVEENALTYLSTHYLYDGVMVTAEGGWDLAADWGFQMAFQAVFENAVVDYDSLRSPTLRLTMGSDPSTPMPFSSPQVADKAGSGGNISSLGGYYNELDYFCGCLLDGRKPEIATGRQALESLRVVLAEIESAKIGGPVSCTK